MSDTNWLARLTGAAPRNSLLDGRPEYRGGPQVSNALHPSYFVPAPQTPREHMMRALYPQTPDERMGANVVRGFTESPATMRVFHGSFSPNLTALDNARLGENFPNRASRAGHWFSTNADDAAFYGDNVYEVNIDGRFASLPSMEQAAERAMAKLDGVSTNPNVTMETRHRAEAYLEYLRQTRDPAFYTNVTAANISKARREGYDGARLVGGETVQNSSAAGDNYVIFDPALARIMGRHSD